MRTWSSRLLASSPARAAYSRRSGSGPGGVLANELASTAGAAERAVASLLAGAEGAAFDWAPGPAAATGTSSLVPRWHVTATTAATRAAPTESNDSRSVRDMRCLQGRGLRRDAFGHAAFDVLEHDLEVRLERRTLHAARRKQLD